MKGLNVVLTSILVFLFFVSFGQNDFPFENSTINIDARIDDLVSRLTLDEKASQMLNSTEAIPRLGIPAYDWWNEALHGLARSGTATIYPQAIAMGATFDKNLVLDVASAISDEARANYNAAINKGYHLKYSGLTFWTPNINIFRDPRWGRGQETYGEDPFLTGLIGSAFVQGLQGDDPNYLKTAACAKHYAVHSGPEKVRHEFDAIVSMQDLHETYLPAFKMLVDAGVESVMGAYNRTNGEACNAHSYLIDEVLRDTWGFDGHIVTDCGALIDFYEGHNIVANEVEAAALAIKHGVNLNCGKVYENIPEAVSEGLITEAEVDKALKQLLKTRFKLGLFDAVNTNPYNKITYDNIDLSANADLAYQVAVKSIVLLKNNGVLPLANNFGKYFITGPNAASIEAMIGNYHGVNSNIVTVVEGIAAKVEHGSQVQYRQGCLLNMPNSNPIDWASGNAKTADATIVVLGVNGLLEGEEGAAIASSSSGDILDYSIPSSQIEYLKRIRGEHNQAVIAVITGGCPVNLSEVHELCDAVLMAWYPGQEGGTAIADILFGKVSPSGRLPITFPKSIVQLPPYEDYAMLGRTYRYMDLEPMYPFGFGLSYSSFAYKKNEFDPLIFRENGMVSVEFIVQNIGTYEADEVIQLYISYKGDGTQIPNFTLRKFERISLLSTESKSMKIELNEEDFMLTNVEGEKELFKGDYIVYVGGALPTTRSTTLGASESLQFKIKID